MQTSLDCAGRILDLTSPVVMGILNVTPDSFSDGGRYDSLNRAMEHAHQMIADGAGIVDIGGESTRPNAQLVSEAEEIDRVVPVIEALRAETDVIVSIDTSSASVMKASVEAGAGIINDVRALNCPGALAAAAECDVPVVLMHSLIEQPEQGFVPQYDDVVAAVADYLKERVQACEQAGIRRKNIVLDPGFGGGMFGKAPAHDLVLVKRFQEFYGERHGLGLPILAGVSRKSFIGAVLGNTADERLAASLAVAVMLAQAGVQIVRVHDVKETADALAMLQAVSAARESVRE